jgi:hypothetical protein
MFKPETIKTTAQIQAEKEVELFVSTRKNLLEKAVVITQSGLYFDANEAAQDRMARAIKACELSGKADSDTIQWSLADTGSGVPTNILVSELKEAFVLAVENMSNIWLR